jgi:hypothetical protein
MHKKGLRFAPVVELAKLNFTYIYHSTKIAKARPGFDDGPEYPSVHINSSSPWFIVSAFGGDQSPSPLTCWRA